MDWPYRLAISCDDILLVPANSRNKHVADGDASMKYDKCPSPFTADIPIINSPMDMVCSKELIMLLMGKGIPTTIQRYFETPEDQITFFGEVWEDAVRKYGPKVLSVNAANCFIQVGSVFKWKDWIDTLLNYRKVSGLKFAIGVDMAQGHTDACIETVAYLRKRCEDMNIMAGNVATKGGYTALEKVGANFIRCGIGGGSICSTRLTTGFGVPTLTTVIDCEDRKMNSYIIADGGFENNGDMVKAIRCGTDLCMIGKILAATDLAPGEKRDANFEITTNPDEYAYCQYRGMSSKTARDASKCRSNASVEGVSGFVPYTDKTEVIVDRIKENFQTAISYYGGCKNWDEFRRYIKVIQITQAGQQESSTRIIKHGKQ